MAKKTTKKRAKRTAKAPAAAPRNNPTTGLSTISTAELRYEISRRNKSIEKLQKKRQSLQSQMHEIDRTLAEYGAAAAGGGGGGKRPRNSEKLSDALARVLKGTTMSVTDAAQAVQQAGYQTTAANFRTIVNQTLIKDSRFDNVSRGQYRAK
jgi:hypothetical protein